MSDIKQSIALPRTVAQDVVAEAAAGIARLSILHGDHPRYAEATHAIDVMATVARILASDGPTFEAAATVSEDMACLCGNAMFAALAILADAHRAEGIDAEDIVRGLPARMERILTD